MGQCDNLEQNAIAIHKNMSNFVQGGIHPDFTGETYLEILKAVKKAVPDIHVHAFSPLEVFQGASTLGIRCSDWHLWLPDGLY